MHTTIGRDYFKREFVEYGRENDFSSEGLDLLFDYLGDEEVELDVISICCDYCESTLEDLNRDCNQEFEDLEEAEDWLQDQTVVVGKTDETIIFGCL